VANRPNPSAIWNSPIDPGSEPSRVARDPALEDADPNHHLWRNGRLWWIAFTVHRVLSTPSF
jgi:hypothetical protein